MNFHENPWLNINGFKNNIKVKCLKTLANLKHKKRFKKKKQNN